MTQPLVPLSLEWRKQHAVAADDALRHAARFLDQVMELMQNGDEVGDLESIVSLTQVMVSIARTHYEAASTYE